MGPGRRPIGHLLRPGRLAGTTLCGAREWRAGRLLRLGGARGVSLVRLDRPAVRRGRPRRESGLVHTVWDAVWISPDAARGRPWDRQPLRRQRPRRGGGRGVRLERRPRVFRAAGVVGGDDAVGPRRSHVRLRSAGREPRRGRGAAAIGRGRESCVRGAPLPARAGGVRPAIRRDAFRERRHRPGCERGLHPRVHAPGRRRGHGIPIEEAMGALAHPADLGGDRRDALRAQPPQRAPPLMDAVRHGHTAQCVSGAAAPRRRRGRAVGDAAARLLLHGGRVAGAAGLPGPSAAVALLVTRRRRLDARPGTDGGRLPAPRPRAGVHSSLLPGDVPPDRVVDTGQPTGSAGPARHVSTLARGRLGVVVRRAVGGERLPGRSHRWRGASGRQIRPPQCLDLGGHRPTGCRVRRRTRQLSPAAAVRTGGGAHAAGVRLGRDLPVFRPRAHDSHALPLRPLALLVAALHLRRAGDPAGPWNDRPRGPPAPGHRIARAVRRSGPHPGAGIGLQQGLVATCHGRGRGRASRGPGRRPPGPRCAGAADSHPCPLRRRGARRTPLGVLDGHGGSTTPLDGHPRRSGGGRQGAARRTGQLRGGLVHPRPRSQRPPPGEQRR